MNRKKTTPLREKMREDLKLRNLSPFTIKSYIQHVIMYSRYYGKSPESLGENEIRKYLKYLMERRK